MSVLGKTSVLLAARRSTGQIEIHAANERVVIGECRRQQLQFLQPVMDEIVDVVVDGWPGPLVTGCRGQNDHLRTDREAAEASEDVTVTLADSLDQAVLVDRGGIGVVRIEQSQ